MSFDVHQIAITFMMFPKRDIPARMKKRECASNLSLPVVGISRMNSVAKF